MRRRLLQRIRGYGSILISIWVLILVFLISEGIVLYTEVQAEAARKQEIKYIAEGQVGKIQYVLESLLSTADTVEVLVKLGNGEIENFDALMRTVMGDRPIKNIALAPKGTIRQIYPLEGNEEALGHDLLHDPARVTDSQKAVDLGQMVLSGPYTLKQGGYGLVGRKPVFLVQETDKLQFWGMVCITLELPDSLEAVQWKVLDKRNYCYCLWRVDPDTGQKDTILESSGEMPEDPVNWSFDVKGSTWILSMAPSGGWQDRGWFMEKSLLALFIAVLFGLLARFIMDLMQNEKELLSSLNQQADHYKKLYQLHDEWRIFRHDYRNHILCLKNLLEKKDVAEANAYLSALSDPILPNKKIIDTKNYVFDALISEKIDLAEQKQIQVETQIYLSKQFGLDGKDWCVLFGNAMDNAIEACEKVVGEQPKIMLQVQCRGNMLQTIIRNTIASVPQRTGRFFATDKPDADMHGIGMNQMYQVVKKYQGVMETKVEEKEFVLTITLFE